MNNNDHTNQHNNKYKRKLVAIMFTDMVGYSSLSQKNEALALELLSEHREIIRRHIREHEGSEIETAGDSFFVEFFSANDAARCAIQIQTELNARNNNVTKEKQILIRIGLHIGDVVHIDTKVHGDGVNIAARFEPLATPGGIALSEDFARAVRNKLPYPVIHKGTAHLKNITAPMNIFCIQLPWLKEKSLDIKEPAEKAKIKIKPWLWIIAAIVFFVIIYYFPLLTKETPKKSRLAVMPFVNISDDSTNKYFADGLTEQIISSLSNLSGLNVIARSSVIKYKSKSGNLDEMGKDLNIGSILEGSIRKQINKVRISVRLIDVARQENIWAMFYDRELEDIFMIQVDIARDIARELQIKIGSSEQERITKKNSVNADALAAYFQGRFYLNRRNINDIRKSIFYFENAIKYDSTFALAYTGLADAYTLMGAAGFETTSVTEAMSRAKQYALQALELDNNLSEAHTSLAYIKFRIEWDFGGAEKEFKRAIELGPSNAQAYEWYALLLALRGKFDEGLQKMKIARDLNPLSASVNNGIGRIYYFMSEYDKAVKQFQKIIDADPGYAESHFSLGLAYFKKKDYEKAISELEKAVILSSHRLVILADLAYVYGITGRKDKLLEIKDEFDKRSQSEVVPGFYYIPIYAALNDLDMFFELNNRALKEHEAFLLYMKADPMFGEVRNDPRYQSIIDKIGL